MKIRVILMSQITCENNLMLILVMVCVFSFVGVPIVAETLVEDFDALAAYEFGMSRASLHRISEVVRAANAGQYEGSYTVQDLESMLATILDTDTTVDAKRFVCRMLGEIGGKESVSALINQFENKAVFSSALVALEQNRNDVAATALAALLDKASKEEQLAIVAALGRQGNPVSIPVLAARLDAADMDLVIAAIQALANLASPEACHVVLDKVVASGDELQPLMIDAFLQCSSCMADTDAEATDTLLKQLKQVEYPTHIRLAAIDSLIQRYPQDKRQLLLDALQNEDIALTHGALMLARQNPDADIVTALAEILEQASVERKAPLLAILSDFGDPSVLPVIIKLVDHEDAEIRILALQAMGALGNVDQVDFLLTRATAGPVKEQRAAREVLTRLADPAVNERLLNIASRPARDDIRIQAISTLAERNAQETAPTLFALAKRSSAEIRKEALRALRTLAPPEMLPELLTLIVPRTLEPVRDLLPQTIAQTADRIADPLVKAEAIIKALSEADNDDVRVILLESLGLLGTDAAFEAVRSYPDTTSTAVRRAMVSALTRFQSPEALGELRGLLLTERDESVRAKIFSGYIASLRNATEVALVNVIPHLQTAYEQAKSPKECRDFLAAATQLSSLTTLGLIEKMAARGDVTAEATQALVKVCAALAGAYPETVSQKLEALVAEGNLPEALANAAKQTLEFMKRTEGYIMAWALAGPFYEANVSADSLFALEFPPEVDKENANWRIMPVIPDANPAYVMELNRVIGGDDRVAFLRTTITAPEELDAILELGTNDGCRIWWNGTLIHALNVGRPLAPGQDKLEVQLAAGGNDLMVAVFQQGGAWGAAARLVGKDGKPLGLKCSPAINE